MSEVDDQARIKRLDIVGGALQAELIPPQSFATAFIETARASLGSADNYMEYELSDGTTGERFAVRVQRVGKLTPHQARQEAEAERDGLLFTLQHVQATLNRWIRPHSTAHAHDCMHAVAELQRLLNPHREEPDV